MFYTLSKILNFLCFPLSLGLLLLILFAWLQRSKRRRAVAWGLFWLAVAGLWACSTGPVATLLLRPLEREFENAALPAQVDAVVVLGGMIDLGRSSDRHLALNPNADRFVEAVDIVRRMPQATLVFSGGNGRLLSTEAPEAPILRMWAMKLGIPGDRILTDATSKNTRENAVESKRILAAHHLRSVLLITSAYHMRRSVRCFSKLGIHVTPYAVDFRSHPIAVDPLVWVPDVANLEDSSAAIKEYLGLLTYKLQGYN